MSTTKVSAALMEAGTKGADISSASSITIGLDGSYMDITGTTTIATMVCDPGRIFTLQFDSAVTLTHSSTLYLAGAVDFVTEANDHLTFVAVAANDVRQIGAGLKDGGSPVAASSGLTSKTVGATYDLTTASGTQDITGFGFQPSAFITHCFVYNGIVGCWGFTDFTRSQEIHHLHGGTAFSGDGHADPGYAFQIETGNGHYQKGAVAVLSDGFRITWTKTGTPSGTANLYTLGFK